MSVDSQNWNQWPEASRRPNFHTSKWLSKSSISGGGHGESLVGQVFTQDHMQVPKRFWNQMDAAGQMFSKALSPPKNIVP